MADPKTLADIEEILSRDAEPEESKAEAFKRLAKFRFGKVVDRMALIGSLSNTGNYDYTAEQVDRMFANLHKEVDKIKGLFKVKADDADVDPFA